MQSIKLIRGAIKQVLERLGLSVVGIGLEHPKNEIYGDWSSNVAVANGGRKIAERIVEELKKDRELVKMVEKIEVAGAGFINFYLTKSYFWQRVSEANKDDFGSNRSGQDKLVIVEYSSPNIAKPFTVGHFRSTIIGDAVANLMEINGWRVLRDNHLGDWGTQFGKQIVAIKRWSDVDKTDYTVKELVELYIKFHQEAERDKRLVDEAREWFKRLEDGDKEARRIWQMCIEASWQEFERIYKLLGVKFSQEFDGGRGLGESFFEDKMQVVIDELEQKGMLQEGKGGAKLVFFENDKYPPAMILKGDGATLYHTRDLATDKYRLEKYQPDLVINEVGAEQSLYFKQLFEMERKLGWYQEGERVHIGHGLIRLKQGKMSTRKGNVIWLSELLDEAVERAKSLQKKGSEQRLAEIVGIGALKWNDLKGEAKREIVFDWNEVLKMKGDSGPYVQYVVARAKSILRKVSDDWQTRVESEFEFSGESLSLVRWLDRYPEVVSEAGRRYAPYMIANYVYELATRFNRFYNQDQIIGSRDEASRLWLVRAVVKVLESGLGILGIEALERM